jgi:hypothetical protein
MAMQQDKGHFALKDAIGALAESAASHWKPMLVAAPLIGAALFFATGSHAQTSGSATPAGTTAATGPIAPITAPTAARTGRPKVLSEQPNARTGGGPKVRDPGPRPPLRVSDPATQAPASEPVAQPTERRRKGPKERDDPVSTRTGRPKERDDSPHNRSSLLLHALGGAAAIAAIVAGTSGNGKPESQ